MVIGKGELPQIFVEDGNIGYQKGSLEETTIGESLRMGDHQVPCVATDLGVLW